jgi:CubicO group peptidase (beta-lactamase class C family)
MENSHRSKRPLANGTFVELEKFAQEELERLNVPGAAIAIVHGTELVFAKGFGIANVETGVPVLPETLFRIGSTTKIFTAAVLAGLADEGKIDLNEPLRSYINGLSPRLASLTPHELLSHTAGLKDEAPCYGLHDVSTLADTARSWNDDYVFTQPGSVFSYASPGFTLAGLLMEQIGGNAYACEITQKLLKPLGMKTATFQPTVAMTHPLSQGHTCLPQTTPAIVRPFTDHAAYWPAGFLFSSVNDLARFAIAFMNDGQLENKQALSQSVIRKLSTPVASVHSDRSGKGQYGYGLFITEYRGTRLLQHGGTIRGFICSFTMVPQHRVAVITIANAIASLEKVERKALELMLPLEAQSEPTPTEVLPVDEVQIAKYTGLYRQAELEIKIVTKDGKLFLQQHGSEFPMIKIGDHRFSFIPPGSSESYELVFVCSSQTKADYLHFSLRALKRVHNGN